MTTKEFLKFSQGCPYCEGNPEAGAVCHYSGEAAFTCEIENCPLFQHRRCVMNFTYTCNGSIAEIYILLEPANRRGTFYKKLITQDFVDFLNRYYSPDKISEIPTREMCDTWAFAIFEEKIAFHVRMKCPTTLDIHKFAKELYKISQQQLTQAIEDYDKILTVLRIAQK